MGYSGEVRCYTKEEWTLPVTFWQVEGKAWTQDWMPDRLVMAKMKSKLMQMHR